MDKIPSALAAELSEAKTGVKIDRIDIAHYKGGDLVVGYDKGKQVLLKGNGLYVNLDQAGVNNLVEHGAKLDKSGGKPGWYLKDGNNLRKTLYEDYRFSEQEGAFTSRSNDGANDRAWKAKGRDGQGQEIDGEIIKGKVNALGAFIQTDKDSNLQSLRRSDNTQVIPKFIAAKTPGAQPVMDSFTEVDAKGDEQV